MVTKFKHACANYEFRETHDLGKALYIDPNSKLITNLHEAYC